MSLNNAILLTAVLVASAVAGYQFYEFRARSQAADPVMRKGPDTNRESVIAPDPAGVRHRPDFALPDTDGNLRDISEWDGQPMVVNFWATWCPPCRREIPLLIEMQAEAARHGIVIIGIAMDRMEDVQRYAQQNPFNYPVLVGEQEAVDAAEGYGADVVGLPLTVFTDATGKVVDIHAGELSRTDLADGLARLAGVPIVPPTPATP